MSKSSHPRSQKPIPHISLFFPEEFNRQDKTDLVWHIIHHLQRDVEQKGDGQGSFYYNLSHIINASSKGALAIALDSSGNVCGFAVFGCPYERSHSFDKKELRWTTPPFALTIDILEVFTTGVGMGTRMLRLIEKHALSTGHKFIKVSPIKEAIGFWDKQGFAKILKNKEEFGDIDYLSSNHFYWLKQLIA